MAFNAGNAFVTVGPRFTGFQGAVNRQMGSIMPAAGRSAGTQFGKGVGQGATAGIDSELPGLKRAAENAGKVVQSAAEKSVKARDTAADAAGKLRVAEEKLNQVRESGKATPDQLAAAEERVASAQRKVEQTTRAADGAQKTYVEAMKKSSAAHEVLQKAAEESEKATKDAGKSSAEASKSYASGWRGVGQRIKTHLAGGVKTAVAAAKKQAEDGGRKAGNGFSGAFKGAVGGLAAGFSIAAVGSFVSDTVNLAGEAEQSIGAVDAVFKENSKVMHDWAASADRAVGLSANKYREVGVLLGSQLKNAGTPMEQLAGKTNDLITLGADLSSMFGGTAKEAIEAISSALKGEMDPIERYGITLSQASLEAEALSKGIIKPTKDAVAIEEAATKMTLAQTKYNEAIKKHGKDSDEAARAQLGLASAERAFNKASAGKLPKLEAESKALAIQSALYSQSVDSQGNFMREEDTFEHKRQVALESWANLKETLGNAFLPAMTNVFGFIGDTAIPALQTFGGWVQQNQAWLKPLGVTLLGVGGSLLAFKAVIPIIMGVTQAVNLFKGGFAALNLVMKANVIGIIISAIAGLVAGFMYLWNTNEGFRNFFIATWNNIKDFFLTVWNSYLKPAFKALGDFWTNALAPALKNAWELVIKPAFSALGSFFKWVWESVLKPAFKSLMNFWKNTLAPALKWTWENVLKPVFSALGSFFKWTWENVLKPAFNAVKSAWKGISDRINYVWETFIKPVFDTFGKILKGDFVGAFQTAKDAVEKIWNDIKGVVKKPIEFVVNKVINDGLIGAFNKVTGFIDPEHKVIPKIGNVALPAGFATGGWTGPGTKYTPAGIVHADEFVVRKESQRSIEKTAPGFLDGLNRFGAKALGYANGGFVRPVKGGSYTSKFGASRGRYPHAGLDIAVPIGTPVFSPMDGTVRAARTNAVPGRSGIGILVDHANGISTYQGHLSRLLAQVGQQVKAGQQIALSGNTGRSTGPHVHSEVWINGKPVDPWSYINGGAMPVGGSGGGGFNPLQALIDFKDSIVGRFKESFSGGGMFADLAQGAGTKLTSDILGWFPAQMAKIGDFAQDVWGNTKDFFNGKDSDVQSAVRGVANGYGWGSGRQWDSLSKLINKESSWNPNAQNPTSTAYGLFQFLNSTWGSYGAKTSDPAGQARAGMKYIQQRYGDPEKAWAFHKKHNWYAEGGLVKPSLYDNGGVLPTGLTSILNNTRKPEAILNPAQWSSVMKSIEVSRQIANHGTATTVYNLQTPQGATVGDLMSELKFARRIDARGGVR